MNNNFLPYQLKKTNEDYNNLSTQLAEKVAKGDTSVNIKDFGAKGDGVTDDTAAIQAAINSLTYSDNPTSIPEMGIVFFPKGNYRISSSINIKGALIIQGAGRDSAIISVNGNFDALTVLESTGTTAGCETTIQDIKIKSTLSTPTAGAAINIGYNFTSVLPTNINIARCHIFGTYYGIALGGVVIGAVDNVNIQYCISDGVITSRTMNSLSFRNTYVSRCGGHGYNFKGNYCAFINTASDSNGGDGYHFHNNGAGDYTAHLTMLGCGAESNTGSGLYMDTGKDISVLNCFFNPTGSHSIVLNNVTHATITDYELNTSTAGKYGIYSTGSTNITLIGGYASAPNGLLNDYTQCTVINYGGNGAGIGIGGTPNGVPYAATIPQTGSDHIMKMSRTAIGTYYLDVTSSGMFGVNTGTGVTPLQILSGTPDECLRLYSGGIFSAQGVNLKSPNGTFYKLVVDNTGVLSTAPGTAT